MPLISNITDNKQQLKIEKKKVFKTLKNIYSFR